jgi:4-hydroxythreonine-4-phosphate dehydrogenase
VLDPANADYVLRTLRKAAALVAADAPFDALATAPVQKSVINDAGFAFSGHTELLAQLTGAAQPVMLLVKDSLRVALATTHLPLAAVPAAITPTRISDVIRILQRGLRSQFGITRPRILVCGLNPHAGESGHLGREEQLVIEPTLDALRSEGMDLVGPVPADTAFTAERLKGISAVLAMFHDQGLPVIKAGGFGGIVNVTLGLPIIRTSVDHGTALELAGTGKASAASLLAAVLLARRMVVGPTPH